MFIRLRIATIALASAALSVGLLGLTTPADKADRAPSRQVEDHAAKP